jgi:hypothetical protein
MESRERSNEHAGCIKWHFWVDERLAASQEGLSFMEFVIKNTLTTFSRLLNVVLTSKVYATVMLVLLRSGNLKARRWVRFMPSFVQINQLIHIFLIETYSPTYYCFLNKINLNSAQNYWVLGLFPSSGVFGSRERRFGIRSSFRNVLFLLPRTPGDKKN